MSTKKKPAVQQVTVETRTLHNLVKPVIPCVETTGMLPVLNAVQIELRGEYLVACATDRFRVGISRQPLAWEDGKVAPAPKGVEFKALIALGDLQHLLKLFPVGRHGGGAVTLTIDGDKLLAEATGGLGLTFSDLRVGYTLNDGDFPDLDTIAHGVLTAEGDRLTSLAVAPEYIASFKAAVLDRHDAMEIITPTAGNKPLVCKVGDHFLGLVMPRHQRAGSSEDDWPAWSDFLRPSKKAEVAA